MLRGKRRRTPDFTRQAVHREQMRVLLYDEALYQSEMLQNTTASDLPDARSTHENVPKTDDPLFLGPDLAEHADRIKFKNNKMSSEILPRTQRMLHCLCQVRGPQKPPGQSWWLTEYNHETAGSLCKSQWRTREPLGSGALDKLGRYRSAHSQRRLALRGNPCVICLRFPRLRIQSWERQLFQRGVWLFLAVNLRGDLRQLGP